MFSLFVSVFLHNWLFFALQKMSDENPTSASSSKQPTKTYLYLHPSENPATSPVSPVLDLTNYHSWSQSFTTALNAKNKVAFILCLHPCPQKDDPTFLAWTHCNNMVVSWFVHSISIHIRQNIVWMDVAFDIWNDLKVTYSQRGLSRISDLQLEGASLSSLICLLRSILQN